LSDIALRTLTIDGEEDPFLSCFIGGSSYICPNT
jgi:hypothetical protein